MAKSLICIQDVHEARSSAFGILLADLAASTRYSSISAAEPGTVRRHRVTTTECLGSKVQQCTMTEISAEHFSAG